MGTQRYTRGIGGSRWVSITAIMTALALVGNYALVAVPNLELGSSMLFLTAYIFGAHMAIWSTLIMSLLFGIINPWGAFIPQIWMSQVVGWFYIVATGSIMGRVRPSGERLEPKKWELAIAGAFVTFIFEQVTNIGYSVTFGVPFYIAITAAIPFTLLHIVSNTIIFSQVVPMLDSALTQQLKGLIWNAETEKDSIRGTDLQFYGETIS
ncbi:MAG: ECF transporter S component [Candidatus Thorarchaeota archaeon]